MRRETELFFEHVVLEDRSILDFIDGRYTFLNERLARHYGMRMSTARSSAESTRRHAARRRS